MKPKKNAPGPKFVAYFGPVLAALRDLGDSGRPQEVNEKVAVALNLPETILNETLKSGTSRYANQIHWARFYLNKAGLISSPTHGVWALTDTGRKTNLDHASAYELFRRINPTLSNKKNSPDEAIDAQDFLTPVMPDEDTEQGLGFRDELAKTLKGLSPGGFERLCQLILRTIGFEEVEVTGKTGDGGIDGIGTLRINAVLRDRVVFQCKRYTDQVGPEQIRGFRGALQGRADRGIFLTTGTFSVAARREATRDGAVRIEIVDLEELMNLLVDFKMGVVERTIHEIDLGFFKEYMPSETPKIG